VELLPLAAACINQRNMTFSCTKKVLDKIGKHRNLSDVKDDVHLYNWYVDLINLERKNYVLFTHSLTLFSFFFYAGTKKEFANIESLFEDELEEQITRNVTSSERALALLLAKTENITFSKTNSRSILGSMNDFKHQMKIQIQYKGPLPKTKDLIIHYMNQCPMRGINYMTPHAMMSEELKKI